ncbi:MAG: phosphoenolpyruvate carboxykinase (GTP) [Candidatus Omnitrophica bacterium CG11_big_fil_rev_8_21_14_0_20_45_26]|uniref:Phosphoenolpyruvate carboxykinase [GTP] n=1 Tax=Candidatus Abzuiibacterium crystallinum TaxID=1974748 RepID=A0A2H0LMT6_9BACT|nr:MAG: phosphoenolpyruvate carboxykinase (GTP) [Candidatus Omnitrophica bacterium CG11_big_fil_rev_8_21_14_0_20_45_26]PIW63939.1 MAG: phosphoenolpyruvate carboxykinase (GTP) [Candidatus Omnitrophica bacterium CG12_big_fil_rev_8_21_14_0_65_45_16]
MAVANQIITENKIVINWVNEIAELCQPDKIYYCDGSEEEKQKLTEEAVHLGEVEYLNQEKLPGCLYSRSDINDVARTEHLTYICTRKKEDAGPTNNWLDPQQAYQKLHDTLRGSMKGRTLYVVPFIMGPAGSPISKIGIELTDSVYVVLNMRIMTRMGKIAFDQLGDSDDFTRCIHGKVKLDINHRAIAHFPEDNTIISVNTAYGGNALLGKKCLALRIGSFLGKTQDWMAEHMLIIGIETPKGDIHYITAAFPSQCGKTNLAMLVPPAPLKKLGYKVWTVGDDIAWLKIGPDGRLWAINPENGFFGVAPGTSMKSNPNALKTIQKNTIFTNVLKTPEGTVWWEGLDGDPPKEGTNWKGEPWTPASKDKGAHPNSRFTAPVEQCPSVSPEFENPKGVPISAMIFGGRRAKVAPLVYETFNWERGVYAGATMASETTSAATGQVGVVRRDPMAMLPFMGYHVGDYWRHWLNMGKKIKHAPKIFHVNWFRKNEKGDFIWPGFGENLRALLWVIERCQGKGQAQETPIGYVPTANALNTEGLDLSKADLESLLSVDSAEWQEELKGQVEFFDKVGDRCPKEIREIHASLTKSFA